MSDVNTRTVNELITDASKIIGLYSADRMLPPYIMEEGIKILNSSIDMLEADSILIPYNKILTFNTVVGKMDYYISKDTGADVNYDKPVLISYLQLLYANVRYPVSQIQDNQFYESWLVENLSGRPINWFYQSSPTGTTVYLYPVPNMVYSVTLKAKFAMSNLYNGDTLESITPAFYEFLIHVVARNLAKRYKYTDAPNGGWSELLEADYQRMMGLFKVKDDRDFSMKLDSTLNSRRQMPYLIWGYP